MALVDERGRIGGKVNLIDAVIAVVVLGLIPVAFGAFLLFRTPMPKLLAVGPNSLYQGGNLRVRIDGENLRPFTSKLRMLRNRPEDSFDAIKDSICG